MLLPVQNSSILLVSTSRAVAGKGQTAVGVWGGSTNSRPGWVLSGWLRKGVRETFQEELEKLQRVELIVDDVRELIPPRPSWLGGAWCSTRYLGKEACYTEDSSLAHRKGTHIH